MIRITIELFPHGDSNRSKVLGIMDIWNDGSGDINTGNYKFCAWKAGTPKDILHMQHTVAKAKWAGSISNFPRKRLLVWDLLLRCLKEVWGKRND